MRISVLFSEFTDSYNYSIFLHMSPYKIEMYVYVCITLFKHVYLFVHFTLMQKSNNM